MILKDVQASGDQPQASPSSMPLPSRIVIINDASTALGGATGLALLSAELLSARNISVTYIAGDDGKSDRLQSLGIEVLSVGGRGLINEKTRKAMVSGLYNRATRDVLGKWISENDAPDVIYHLHGWSKILSPSVFDALLPVAARTVIHAHDFFLACPNGGFMDYPKGEPCERVPLSAACCFTNCDKRSYVQKVWRIGRQFIMKPRLIRRQWGRVLMIHALMAPYMEKAGLSAERLSVLPNPSEAFSENRVPVEDNDAFIFIGRLEPEKGIEDAIAATKMARVPLKVFGDGPLRDKLEKKHPDVQFFGWRTRKEISQGIQDGRALIMPSRYPEPFGLVAAEAARSGLPVILAETAFLSEEFVRHGIGFRCNTRSAKELANTIIKVREMPREHLQDISIRAQTAADHISTTPELWTNALVDHYSSILHAR